MSRTQYSKVAIRILDTRMYEYLPSYVTPGSAGLDLRCCLNSEVTIEPGGTELLSTGIAIHIKDPLLAGLIVPRSGLGHKHGIILGNTVGLIDSDYQGELKISCWNRGEKSYVIQPYERIAQLVIIPIAKIDLEIVDSFEVSSRGNKGFGSSGTHKIR